MPLLLVVVAAGIVGVAVWRAVQAVREGRASEAWVARPCEILSSRVAATTSGGDTPTTVYSVDVRYRYRVDGEGFEGDRYAVASSLDRATAEAAVASLPPGTHTECFVDPADPTRAVLVRGGQGSVLGLLVFGALLFVVFPLLAMGAFHLWDRLRGR